LKCPNCQFRSKKGEKFCGRCGTRLILACPRCGFENPPDYKFCAECGLNFSTGKKPRPLPGMARMALVRGREVRTPRPLQRARIRPPEEERPAPLESPQPPAIPDQPPPAVTDEKAEGLQKKAEAAGIEEKAGAVETEEVMEPEDVSKEEELPPTVTGISFWNRFDQGIIGLLAII
jgi:hypothetical protein